jgi:para-nitrobenzyl esterase
MRTLCWFVGAALFASGCAQLGAERPQTLVGTSWQLVRLEGGDGMVRTPDDKSKYTLAFSDDEVFNVRFDCNRGRGGWKSPGARQLEFGAMAMTRAACPPGSLHDQLVKHWPYVRSYLIKGGRLYLSLMADGGVYEFEPTPK